MHDWNVTVLTAAGAPVVEAGITIGGGMPQHGHGLPTRPRVTQILGDGRYLVQGVKFSMQGWWTLELAISVAEGADVATFNIVL